MHLHRLIGGLLSFKKLIKSRLLLEYTKERNEKCPPETVLKDIFCSGFKHDITLALFIEIFKIFLCFSSLQLCNISSKQR